MLLPAPNVDSVTYNLNNGPEPLVQVTENRQQVMIYCLREAAKEKEKDRRSSEGSLGMGGALFSNFYFYIPTEKQREEQKKSTS